MKILDLSQIDFDVEPWQDGDFWGWGPMETWAAYAMHGGDVFYTAWAHGGQVFAKWEQESSPDLAKKRLQELVKAFKGC